MAEQPSVEEATGNDDWQGGVVVLEDQYLINPGVPLAGLDSPSAKAYSTEDRHDLGRRLFALICTPGIPPRIDDMVAVKGDVIPGLLPLVDWGVVFWPPLGQRCMVVIYARPMGGRFIDVQAKLKNLISESDLQSKIIIPFIGALGALDERYISHREVRPDNLFYMDETHEHIVLGDYLTTPPGFDQPLTVETIERGMATRGGCGEGTVMDDLYALGSTLALILEPDNPVSSMSDDDLIRSKIERGSYTTLFGKARIPVSLLEPIRGFMADAEESRWGLEETKFWISGNRQTPMQNKPAPKSDTPFEFDGSEYTNTRTLAWALFGNISEAAKVIKGKLLETWVRRGLKNPELGDAVEGVVAFAKVHVSESKGSDDSLVCRICMILDPHAPIRYKGIAVNIDGFGPTMVVEYLHQGNMRVCAEIIVNEFPSMWLDNQPENFLGAADYHKTFRQLKGFIVINDLGYGIERCLYELNRGISCQSNLVAEEYIDSLEDLLPALDKAASRVDVKTRPIDRHIAAFIAANFDQDIYPHLKALDSNKEETFLIGLLSLYAYLQWKLKNAALLGLSSWIGGMLGPAINSYNNRNTRRDIEREIPQLVRKGSLPELFDLIDNAEKRKEDKEGYAAARAEYATAELEASRIDTSDDASSETMNRKGRKAAAVTSVILTLVVGILIYLIKYW
ncbi:MAG TPA: hypothetical protein ENI55_01125 [Alphaproteobacteria bacterium]|nr:hypothetical protein [Alphaproteobacteria bacterium]